MLVARRVDNVETNMLIIYIAPSLGILRMGCLMLYSRMNNMCRWGLRFHRISKTESSFRKFGVETTEGYISGV